MSSVSQDPPPPSADAIREWLTRHLAERLHVAAGEIDPRAPLAGMNLDSMQFVVLVGELEDHLGCRFQDNPLIDYPTIESLSAFLAEELARGRTVINPIPRQDCP